jgi:branched-chain amino acid transport system permease protein
LRPLFNRIGTQTLHSGIRPATVYVPIAVIVGILLPLLVHSGYVIDILDDMLIWAVLTIGLNVVVGFSGLLDLGYIAFFAIGGYTFGVLGSHFKIGMWISIPIAVVLVLIASVIIGIPTLRLRSDYLAIMTLGFGEIIYLSVNNLNQWTGGPNGLYNMPTPKFFTTPLVQANQFYWFLLILLFITVLVVYRLRYSHIGRAWLAIRQDELAAKANGVQVVKYKLYAYMSGAFWAGIAGVLFAAKQTIVSPTSFAFSESFYVLASVIIGGMGSIPGAVVGGFLFVIISESMQGIAQNYSGIIFSVALLIVILLRPKGLWPAVLRNRKRSPGDGKRKSPPLELIHLKNVIQFPSEQGPSEDGRGPKLSEDERGLKPYGDRRGPGTSEGERGLKQSEDDRRPKQSESNPLLRAENICVRFGGVQALQHVSLFVNPGEIVSIIGPNGAGKTTLLNAISGFIKPQSGSVVFRGHDLTKRSVEIRARQGMARTFQTPRLLPTLSVQDNIVQAAHSTFESTIFSVMLGFRKHRQEERKALDESIQLMEALGLSDIAGQNPADLPYGIQRKCEIARCLALHPSLILLDEPAAGMNNSETRELADLLLRIRDLGLTLVIIEHDMSIVRKVSDRVIAMDRGEVISDGDADAVLSNETVVRSYLGN